MSKIVDYILLEIERQGKSVAEFERKAGISNGYLENTKKRGSDISKKILDKIRKNAPEEWNALKDPPELDDPFPLQNDNERGEIVVDGATYSYETKEDILRMLEKSLDANTKHATANERNAHSLSRLIILMEKKFSSGGRGGASATSKGSRKALKDSFEELPDNKESDSLKSHHQQKDTLKNSDK